MQTSTMRNTVNSDVLINQLPFDIFNLIFRLFFRAIADGRFPLIVSQVCQLWRRFAIDCKFLWTAIFFGSKGRMGLTWEGQKLWIHRSGDLPLVIGIGITGEEAETNVIQSIIKTIELGTGRCSHLAVCCPHNRVLQAVLEQLQLIQFPILKNLNIMRTNRPGWDGKLLGQPTPRLRLVQSSNLCIDFTSSTFNTVRSITLWTQKPHSGEVEALWINLVYHILASVPELRHLKIEYKPEALNLPAYIPPFPTPTAILNHDHLEELWSHNKGASTLEQLLPWVRMPSLQGVWMAERSGLHRCRWTFSNGSFPIIQRYHPFPSLLQFQIRLRTSSTIQDDLWGALRCLPKLRKLEMQRFLVNEFQGIQELGRGWPELVHLVFRASKGVTLRVLREVIEMRAKDAELATLERLDLVSCEIDEDEETLKWLRSLGNFVVDIRESASSSVI